MHHLNLILLYIHPVFFFPRSFRFTTRTTSTCTYWVVLAADTGPFLAPTIQRHGEMFGKMSTKRAVVNVYINKPICNALQMDYKYNTVLYLPQSPGCSRMGSCLFTFLDNSEMGGRKDHGIRLVMANRNRGFNSISDFIGLRKKSQFDFPQNMCW